MHLDQVIQNNEHNFFMMASFHVLLTIKVNWGQYWLEYSLRSKCQELSVGKQKKNCFYLFILNSHPVLIRAVIIQNGVKQPPPEFPQNFFLKKFHVSFFIKYPCACCQQNKRQQTRMASSRAQCQTENIHPLARFLPWTLLRADKGTSTLPLSKDEGQQYMSKSGPICYTPQDQHRKKKDNKNNQ